MNIIAASHYYYADNFGPEYAPVSLDMLGPVFKWLLVQKGVSPETYPTYYVYVSPKTNKVSMYGCRDKEPHRGSPVTKIV